MYLLPAIGLSPGGSSTSHIYTKQQYTKQHNNTENTVRNIENNKNTTEIQSEVSLNEVKVTWRTDVIYVKCLCFKVYWSEESYSEVLGDKSILYSSGTIWFGVCCLLLWWF